MKNFKILVQGKIRKIEMKKQITNHSLLRDTRGEGGKILIKTLNPPTSLELNPKEVKYGNTNK